MTKCLFQKWRSVNIFLRMVSSSSPPPSAASHDANPADAADGQTQRGALLVFEGCDRSGKTTQTGLLHEYLKANGHQVELMRFPDRTTLIGKMIDEYLKSGNNLPDQSIHLLFSANRWEAAAVLKEKINAGVTLVVDRYAYSGVAFSASKGLDLKWCKSPDVGLPVPDAVFYCDIPPEIAQQRGGYGEERYERLDVQKRVYEQFAHLKDPTWQVIDATRSVDDIHADIRHRADAVISHGCTFPLKDTLWVEG